LAGKIMLVDQEQEPLGEIEIEEAKSGLPDKYRDKSLEEVVRMHQEAEKLIGKQAQEVGEVRKLADELIKQNLSSKQPQQEEPEVDFFENPQKAVQATIDRHPDVLAARQAGVDFKRMQVQQKLTKEHPDYSQVVGDPEFQNWVKNSSVRIGLYAKADAEFDYESANELLSTFKQLRGVQATKAEQTSTATRAKNMKAAQVDIGGSGESSKRVYRRADLIRLKMTDPARYETLSDEIMQAYSDGRVR
jgi:PBP1b-binding outer membrane lipoprotein LpoB